jgi:branched-chain amino acid transport system ATP-binding protein
VALLEVSGLRASYGPVDVVHGIDLCVDEGEIVVLLGANGAGKTTTLRALCRMDLVSVRGDVRFDGRSLTGARPETVVRRGIAHVPQGRGTFGELTVEENLTIGAHTRPGGRARAAVGADRTDRRSGIRADVERWLDAFPRLGQLRDQPAGRLSGGEQQMLAVARALMSRPRLLLLDEPSLGLAPIVIQDLFRRFAELNHESGTAMLIVEQNANLALSVAGRGYVLETGEIVLRGAAAELQSDDAVRRAYLGF